MFTIFKIGNISGKNSNHKTNYKKDNLLIPGAVVTGLSGTIGTSGIVFSNNFVLNQRLIGLVSKWPLVIKNTIETNKNELISWSTGSVQKNITEKNILELKLSKNFCDFFNEKLSDLYLSIVRRQELITRIISLLIERNII